MIDPKLKKAYDDAVVAIALAQVEANQAMNEALAVTGDWLKAQKQLLEAQHGAEKVSAAHFAKQSAYFAALTELSQARTAFAKAVQDIEIASNKSHMQA